MDDTTTYMILSVLKSEGLEEGIKDLLNTAKEGKSKVEKINIEEEGSLELGLYRNEIEYATFRLDLISTILSYKGLREDRKHIKTLCDEIREVIDDLEKLV